MDISPSDIGGACGIAIIEQRAQTYSSQRRGGRLSGSIPPSAGAHFGTLGRWWTKGSGLTDAEASEALKGMAPIIGGFAGGFGGGSLGFLMPAFVFAVNGHPEASFIFGPFGLLFASFGLFMPQMLFRRWCKTAITVGEVESLLADTSDDLKRGYLTLLRDVVRQDGVLPQAKKEVETALRALGAAIERLPALSHANTEAAQFYTQAETVLAQAATETDAVTAASLARQAEALTRSGQSAERSAVVIRRATALRRELAAQIEALRLGLATAYAGGGDGSELARLAEQVRTVANEADAVATANNELDTFLSGTGADRVPKSVSTLMPPIAPQSITATEPHAAVVQVSGAKG